ncbi:MAG: translation initiation factor IF-2 [Clostridia bacterium]|nr:translation initiation factor IF-2 [Clostridia bacterium]
MAAFRAAQDQRLADEEQARRGARAGTTPALAKKEAALAAKETAAQQAPAKETAAQSAAQKTVKPLQKKEPVDRFSRFEKADLTARPAAKKEDRTEKRSSKNILTPGMGVPAGGTVEVVETKAPKTRVVDTRTSNVDLSRYDERLDRFTTPVSDYSPQRQKLKKQDNRSQGKSSKDKNRIAREKIKKLEMEMARKKQLEITVPDEIVVSELASRLKKTSAEVIKQLIKLGVMASVNQVVDYDTAYLVAEEFGAKVTKEVVVTIEEKLFDETQDAEEDLVERSPVVCVMGHVDHGKTSLLDAIRHTNVTEGEAGGITQAIGAYRVSINGRDITFLETHGHEAFTAMRARGAQATDIAILVVAADDGVMPQTVEAINHAKAAGVDVIVAINKMDKPHANPDQVKQELTKYDLLPEEWGGDTICVPVSALTGMGIEQLLESVLLVAEVKELKANPDRRAKGLIIEARLDKGRGPVATVLVQNGTLRQGDIVIAGTSVGRVRAMIDDKGKPLTQAGPSVPVEIVGLSEVPQAGDEFNAVEDEKMARTLAEQRREKAKQEAFGAGSKVSLDDLFARISEGEKTLSVIVKADVDGSAEAVKSSLEKIAVEDVRVSVIHTAVGGITENDVMLASASGAIIVGFNVRPDKHAIDAAERQGVEIRCYRIIYECIEEITAAMKGLLAPEFKEVLLGHAEVRQTIHVPGVGTIAGSYVQDGKVTRRSQIRVLRDGVVIFEDKISSLRRFKDDVREVASGYECGIGLERFNDIKEGDILEAFEMQEVER